MSDLASVIVGNPDDVARIPQLRQGIVTSASPLMVQVGASQTSMACRGLSSYVATVGDVVSVLVISGDRLVLGRASTAPTGSDSTQFVRKSGDTMSGALSMAGGGESIILNNDSAYISWWNAGSRRGYLQGGSNGLTLAAEAAGGRLHLGGGPNGYRLAINDNGTHQLNGNLTMSGNLDLSGGWAYAGSYLFTGTGYVFHHSSDTDTGIYYDSDGNYRLISNGTTALSVASNVVSMPTSSVLRFNGNADNAHQIGYSGETPAYSGEASNGPKLTGWSSVWLHTATGGYAGPYGWDCYLGSAGHLFLSPSCNYLQFSSREFKEDIQTIDPFECLDQVLRWNPVKFTYGGGLDRPSTGFIAEEMVDVTPTAVHVTGPDSERPGWANAMNYSSLTVQLAGAVQALAAEIRELKARP